MNWNRTANSEKGGPKRSFFLITKPLQYLNASNIPDPNYKTCIIVGYFFKAYETFEKVKDCSRYWDSVLFFDNRKEAYDWIYKNREGLQNLYVDSDYGFKNYCFLRKLKKYNIFVYEEGIGNYKGEIRNNNGINKLIRFIYNIVGHQEFIGGAKYTDGIYLYNEKKHRERYPENRKEIRSFGESFSKHLVNFKDKNIFLNAESLNVLNQTKNKKVVLYLTSWLVDSRIGDLLMAYPNFLKIIKPHPHLKKSISEAIHPLFDFVLPGNALIELLIEEMSAKSEKLVILHHNSSAVSYIKDNSKIECVDIS